MVEACVFDYEIDAGQQLSVAGEDLLELGLDGRVEVVWLGEDGEKIYCGV